MVGIDSFEKVPAVLGYFPRGGKSITDVLNVSEVDALQVYFELMDGATILNNMTFRVQIRAPILRKCKEDLAEDQ